MLDLIKKFFCSMGWHKPINKHHSEKDPLKFLVYAECLCNILLIAILQQLKEFDLYDPLG